jgi:hypothetical protein
VPYRLSVDGFVADKVSPKSKRPDRPADERGRGTTCWFGAGRTAVIPRRLSRSPLHTLVNGCVAARLVGDVRVATLSAFKLAAGLPLHNEERTLTAPGHCRGRKSSTGPGPV